MTYEQLMAGLFLAPMVLGEQELRITRWKCCCGTFYKGVKRVDLGTKIIVVFFKSNARRD